MKNSELKDQKKRKPETRKEHGIIKRTYENIKKGFHIERTVKTEKKFKIGFNDADE